VTLLAELKRRNVIRAAGLYLVGAWLVTQVAATLLPVFEAPAWTMKAVVGLLAAGFIPALIVAWVFELTPDGLKRDADVELADSIAPQNARRMERTFLVLLALALGLFAFDRFVLAPRRDAALVAATTKTVKAETGASKQQPINAKSIAVLAFENMSADRDNEYFSDGIAEEILNSLSKVKDLKVAGRTSSFSFKGKHQDLRSIGKALGVAHILEGSVRKQGDKVRVTAQLIRSEDGTHLWSEIYDGDLKDVFALQESIARAITKKLQVTLSGKQAQQLVNSGTENPEAYALYLQASATFNRRDSAHFTEAMAQLEQAATLDPEFARAYSRLAALYGVALNSETVDYDVALSTAEKFARRASQIDPTLAEPHAVLGLTLRYERKYHEANEAFARALALEPDDVTTNFWRAITLTQSGYRRQGIAVLDRTLQLDPLLPNALFWRGREHLADGELDQGERLLRRAAEGGHGFVGVALSQLERARGNREAGISQLAAGLGYFSKAFPAGTADVFARACFGDAKAKAQALVLIDAHYATKPAHVSGVASYVLIHVGQPARAFALMQDQRTTNDGLVMGELFAPPLAEARRAPAFADFLRRMGLAAYWDEAGPPEQCRKNAKGDYACQ
jgi:TolB-like protein/Tfp pilus assembly protein PilF